MKTVKIKTRENVSFSWSNPFKFAVKSDCTVCSYALFDTGFDIILPKDCVINVKPIVDRIIINTFFIGDELHLEVRSVSGEMNFKSGDEIAEIGIYKTELDHVRFVDITGGTMKVVGQPKDIKNDGENK